MISFAFTASNALKSTSKHSSKNLLNKFQKHITLSCFTIYYCRNTRFCDQFTVG
jgi:hypothetical protein